MAGLDRNKKRNNSSSSRVSRFSEVLGAAQDNIQKSGYPDIQESQEPTNQNSETQKDNIQVVEYLNTQKSGYSNTQKIEQLATQESEVASKPREKMPKRENPDYTQTTFRIPKKLSRQINRALMDLADEGIYMDRSDLLEELAGAFIRLADDIGVVEALEQCKNLDTQVSD